MKTCTYFSVVFCGFCRILYWYEKCGYVSDQIRIIALNEKCSARKWEWDENVIASKKNQTKYEPHGSRCTSCMCTLYFIWLKRIDEIQKQKKNHYLCCFSPNPLLLLLLSAVVLVTFHFSCSNYIHHHYEFFFLLLLLLFCAKIRVTLYYYSTKNAIFFVIHSFTASIDVFSVLFFGLCAASTLPSCMYTMHTFTQINNVE